MVFGFPRWLRKPEHKASFIFMLGAYVIMKRQGVPIEIFNNLGLSKIAGGGKPKS